MDFPEQLELGDEDDELLAYVDFASIENNNLNGYYADDVNLEQIHFEDDMEEENPSNVSVGVSESHPPGEGSTASDYKNSEFDFSTGKLWIYPTNYPVRDYQYNIVQQALFKNTLVVLPTGLGKTFIAAVVMYNYYRWFPHGKVVFMAPTKPLVAQQMQACYNIMGIPKSDTIEMTGTMHPGVRQRQWKEKRVIFLTPQVMTNDLSRGSCVAKSFKCLVVDEAHKALGNQSYCQVIRELCKFTNNFRVLALSATPGSTLKAVQTVMNNLLVSHIELRTEDSIDIKPYTHERKVEKVVVPLGEELSAIKEHYIQIMTFVTQRLTRNRALYNMEATRLSKFLLLKARDEFRQNPPQNIQPAQRGTVEADFCLAISLYHGYDLLQLHGLRSLYNFLMGVLSGEKGYGRTRAELLRNADFNTVMDKLHHKFSSDAGAASSKPDVDGKVIVGHPKMQVLETIVVEHFQAYKDKNTATKVVIFSQFRDSVQEIATILNQHQPLVKVMPFIGQSSSGKDIKGFTQKEQLEVMRQFREAGCNTLVSTCVGEEGLDIGDVDLIVCFDAHKSPIRLVQRMGRTGRKREGKIVMLVTEGKEEQIYNQSLSLKKSIHKAILNGAKSLRFYPNNPRMVPASVQPQCHKMFITIPEENKRASASNRKSSSGGKKRQSIVDAFKKQGTSGDLAMNVHLMQTEYEDIRNEFEMASSTAKHLPKVKCMVLTGRQQMLSQEIRPTRDTSQEINLSEWVPWQNRLQKTFHIGHSLQCQHLVKNSEFIEVQRVVGEEEDNYAIEMKQFVNQSYISQSNITSFLLTPAKARGERNPANCATSSPHQDTEGPKASTSNNVNNVPYLVNSDESDTEITSYNTEHSHRETSEARSSLFTELKSSEGSRVVNSSKLISNRKMNPLISNAGKKKNKGQSIISTLTGTPLSSAKSSRIQLLKKSKKTLKKRKSSVSHLLASKLTTVTEANDRDDFENVSQAQASAPQAISDAEGETVVSTSLTDNCEEDQLKNFCDESNRSLNVIHASLDTKRDTRKCDGSEKQELCGLQKDKNSTSNVGKDLSNSKNATATATTQMVPPAPSLRELADSVSSLLTAQDFAELDLDHLVKTWEQENACKTFSDKCANFFNHSEKNVDIKVGASDASAQYSSEWSKLGEEPHTFQKKNIFNQSFLTIDTILQDEKLTIENNKEKNMPSISPTFKKSGFQNVKSKKIVSSQICPTSLGKADNPVLISPVKAVEENPVADSPLKILQASQSGDLSSQTSGSFAAINKHAIPQPQNVSSSNALVDKNNTNNLQRNKFVSKDKTSERKKNFSESFVTLTQAHDCLLTSSSENSHEAVCNQSLLNTNSIVSYSPTHTPSVIEQKIETLPKSKETFKEKYQMLLDTFFRSTPKSSPLKLNKDIETSKIPDIILDAHAMKKKQPCFGERITDNEPDISQRNLETPEKSAAAEDSVLAQFDLGFDLDEVIPPTPDKESPSAPTLTHGVRRPLFSENSTSDTVGPVEPSTEPPQHMDNEHDKTSLKNITQGTENVGYKNAENFQIDFDLGAELDDLDPWSEDCVQRPQSPQSPNDQQARINPQTLSSHGAENSVPQAKEQKHCSPLDKKAVIKWGGENSDGDDMEDKETFSVQEVDSIFKNYKTDQKSHKVISVEPSISNNKVVTSVGTSSNDICKSKLNKLKLDKRKENQPEPKEVNAGNNNLTTTAIPLAQTSQNLQGGCCKTNRPKIRFKLRVPDFSESDDDIVCLGENKSQAISPNNMEKFSRDSDASSSKKSSNSLITSPMQNIESSSAYLTRFSPAQVSCSTPVRPLSKTGRVASFRKDAAHMLTPIPASPKKDCEEFTSANGDHRKWLTKKKPSDSSRKDVTAHKSKWSSHLDVDDLDDFEEAVSFKESPAAAAKAVEQKRKTKHGFVEEEADVSGDPGSSDEDELAEEEGYDMSFIDNHSETQGLDMQAVYLKSVKSPPAGGHYKLQFNACRWRHEDIYSQAPEEDQGLSEYEEDSFCVGSGEQDNETEIESPPKRMKKRKPKTKKMKQVLGKRVIRMIESSSEEEDDRPPVLLTQEFQTNSCKNNPLISSDEEKEGARPAKKKVRRIVDDTLSQVDIYKERDCQDHGLNQISLQEPLAKTKEGFTLLKENHMDTSNRKDLQEHSDIPIQDGDFNLLDDDWLHELDLAPASVSKLKNKHEDKANSKVIVPKINGTEKISHITNIVHGANQSNVTSPVMKTLTSSNSSQAKNLSTGISKTSLNKEPNSGSGNSSNSNSFSSPTSVDQSKSPNITGTTLATPAAKIILSREERLQRQKEKQNKFRQKLAQAQSRRGLGDEDAQEKHLSLMQKTSPLDKVSIGPCARDMQGTELSSESKLSSTSVTTPVIDTSKNNAETPSSERSRSMGGNVLSHEANKSTGPDKTQLQILVDSREISGAQDIISSLRLTHGIVVTARRLSSCDYVVSNHTAVDRLLWSRFSNSTNRSKLSSRLNEMQALYDRCVLIVEDDRVKSGQDKNKKQASHTKYVDTTMACLMQTKVKVYFTSSYGETASVLAELCQAEARKGRSLSVPASLNDRKEDMLNVVLAIPGVTMPQALNLVHRYRNIAELVCSPVAVIQERGQMVLAAAQSIYKFLRHPFDQQMMPHSKR